MAKWTVRYTRSGEEYYRDGVACAKEEFDAALPDKEIGEVAAAATSCWPMRSEALAVHPSQVAAANERAKRHGIAATYDPGTGIATIADRAARRKLLKLEGFHDRSGGYGDG